MSGGIVVGRIFNIQRYSLEDGEGIRTVVFLKGCPLSCLWCHNAESMHREKEISFTESLCLSCQACTAVCKSDCHSFSNNAHIFERDNCTLCGDCTAICPTEAVKIIGEDITAAELIQRILMDRNYYRKNGGVTFSGGEPTAQPDFLVSAVKLCHENGVSVNIETSGFCRTECLSDILPFIDTFLYDCKADSENHRKLTGVEDEIILSNLKMLSENGAKINLRCPIIPGANLTDAFIEKIIKLTCDFTGIKSVSLLPYHRTGVGKALMIGKKAQHEFVVPDAELMNTLRNHIAGRINRKITIN